jgi:hypothetical protein
LKNSVVLCVVGAALLFVAFPLSATPTSVPPFNQCPTLGMAESCAYLLVLGPNGGVNLLFDANVKDVDTQDNVLFGVQNNSGYSISPFNWSGINFPGLPSGGHTYLELKDSFDYGELETDKHDDDPVAPEPSSIALLGTGLIALGVIFWRRAWS